MTINLSTFLGTTFQGNTGTQGATGAQGTIGTQGVQGLSNQGVTGSQGSQGAIGAQGTQGATGSQGDLGSQGLQGVQGLSNQGTQGTQGLQGLSGVSGNAGGIPYIFSTITTDTDPGNGKIQYNNSTIGSVTFIYIDNNDSNSNVQTTWYDTWDDSTNPNQEGYLVIQGSSPTSTTINVWSVTGAVTVASGYYKIPVAHISGSLPADGTALIAQFSRTGNQGSQGASGAQGSQGAQGIQGLSNQGASGAQGIQGLSNQGASGSQGAQGTQGFTGAQGAQGIQGLSNQGASGSQGAQGTQGFTGAQGASGPQGAQGAQGTQGFSPTNIPASTNTTLTSTDAGKHINTTVAIAVSSNTGFATGDMCVIYNNSAATIGINTSGTGVTLRFAGTASVGNRFLSQRGVANILCFAANSYVISGAGLT